MNERLYWLPKPERFSESLKAAKALGNGGGALAALRRLAEHDLDFLETARLDTALQAVLAGAGETAAGFASLKVAFLASSTVDHLLPAIRVGALRRGLLLRTLLGGYGQHLQELMDPGSQLYAFRPDAVVLALDSEQIRLAPSLQASAADCEALVAARVSEWSGLWALARKAGAAVIQQGLVVPPERVLGHLDAAWPAAPARLVKRLNEAAATEAAKEGALFLDMDAVASQCGKQDWCRPALWHHAKQAVSPVFAPLYGDHLARLLSAARGLSRRCLVVDLDDTLWGGVIGDDGLEGIALGQGDGVGEAFLDFQRHLKRLKGRGVLLAACSKNSQDNARLPFERHPETVLRLDDFAAFVANWEDKATGLRTIAERLNLGLDSLVLFDDNPAERALVRRFAPEVAVPEAPRDPAEFVRCLSDAGYFEAIAFTADDARRAEQYRAEARRTEARISATDLGAFLRSLDMEMTVSPFDAEGAARIAQLINKSNQYNLTTRRYTEGQVRAMAEDSGLLTFQVRLSDAYGDHGTISALILKPESPEGRRGYRIDAWLMSCRVLGRQVEVEVLNVVAARAKACGANFLVGEFLQTPKNGPARDHYRRLGFAPAGALWRLELGSFTPTATPIRSRSKQ